MNNINVEQESQTTEAESFYTNLESFSTRELLEKINAEDLKVAQAVQLEIPKIEKFIDACYTYMKDGGRLFYIGAGTSGRLGVVDASECPPTFGVAPDKIIGIIAGGDSAIRQAVEYAEDNVEQGWLDLQQYNIQSKDTVIGISASGTTPYVVNALKTARQNNILTAAISCNFNSPISQIAHHAITPIVGAEFISGSTRMKAGTAQKLILNMISTSLMIKLGHVENNFMIDMQLTNKKLIERGIRMIIKETNVSRQESERLLNKYKSVRLAIESIRKNIY